MQNYLVKTPENRLTVYYWSSEGTGSKGHISMRTYVGGPVGAGEYISWWPKEAPVTGVGLTVAHKDRTFEEDMRDEKNREPMKVEFYSLNVKKINEEYRVFLNSNCNWTLRGALKFNQNQVHKELQCCSGLVYDLLKQGGLGELAPSITKEFDLQLEQKIRLDFERAARNVTHGGTGRAAYTASSNAARAMGRAQTIMQRAAVNARPMANYARSSRQAGIFFGAAWLTIVGGSIVYDLGGDIYNGLSSAVDYASSYFAETDIFISPEVMFRLSKSAEEQEKAKYRILNNPWEIPSSPSPSSNSNSSLKI